MTVSLRISPADRLLVFAPHPDDETLAAGELIQAALAAGAAVRVVFATDGENNPWPQRWLERRWHIGAAERARWAERRRSEGIAALGVLGMASSESVRFLGWPDQGVTEVLMCDADAVGALVDEIYGFGPSHVVMPVLGDRHPDHSALRVMIELALLRAGSDCVRLGYAVHGQEQAARGLFVQRDAVHQQRKCEALAEHVSQTALSGRRLLRVAHRVETFEIANPAPTLVASDAPAIIRIPHRPDWPWSQRCDLLLVMATAGETVPYRFALPELARLGSATTLVDHQGRTTTVVREDDVFDVELPSSAAPIVALYAKLHRSGPRLMIFDREPWRDARELLHAPSAKPDSRAAPGFV
jgi:LmbE family N-acetylglucosaminyl deacetylase